jgi:D-beta-D-heptose 7-phosphate kinase/D-beta-D-heptose 1-phosphate adenosyltransferase
VVKHKLFVKTPRVLVLGDLILDQYYFGKVDRISPEAPVPIVNVFNSKYVLGGAGNVVSNLFELGCENYFIALIGRDYNAKIIKKLLKNKTRFVKLLESDKPTITKLRVMGNNQQLLRLDFEEVEPNSLERESEILYSFNQVIHEIDLVILSDYGKGIITENLCQEIISKCKDYEIPVIVDPKGDDWVKYRKASIITPNFKEFCDVHKDIISKSDENAIRLNGELLINKYLIPKILLTRSEKGMTLIDHEKTLNFATVAKEVFDVSGAGDTVVATLGAFLAAGYDLINAVNVANFAAGVVVGRVGTSPILVEDLKLYLNIK